MPLRASTVVIWNQHALKRETVLDFQVKPSLSQPVLASWPPLALYPLSQLFRFVTIGNPVENRSHGYGSPTLYST